MDQSLNLQRFLDAQKEAYPRALAELRNGRKESHWMWYIFPQLRGLGHSSTAWYFGIENLEEAKAYLAHPVLEKRLREISQVLLALSETDPQKIFGWTDSMKLRSCMTLFAEVGADPVFTQVLEKYYFGEVDAATLERLAQKEVKP